MKILHVITSLRTGGAEKLMVDLLPRFKQDGVEVDLLLLDGTETPFKQQLRDKGIGLYELGRGRIYNPIYIFKLIPYLKKYDIVHTHNFASQLFTAIGSVLCSVVLCTTEHTTANRRRDWLWYRPIERWMYNKYRMVICISDKTEENLKKHLKTYRTNFTTIYNGIDTSAYTSTGILSNELSTSSGCKNLIMVAGFRHQKDQPTVIKALSMLPSEYHIYFIGDGTHRIKCEELAKELNLVERCHFLGVRTDVPSLLHAADLVIMSSIWEGFGLAAVEGMASHKPVIASDVSGLREIVAGAGLLFEQGNAQDLASKIQTLIEDKQLYQDTADKCLKRAFKYDISTMVKGYEKIYNELINNK